MDHFPTFKRWWQAIREAMQPVPATESLSVRLEDEDGVPVNPPKRRKRSKPTTKRTVRKRKTKKK